MFQTYCIFSDLGFLSSGGGAGGWGISQVTSMNLYKFRTVQS